MKPHRVRSDRAMTDNLPTLAGTASTILFVLSALPMLTKAIRTKDLASYSLGNIATANAGNLVYSVYVFALPPGPIWLLHSFYLVSTALMLIWYLRYEWRPQRDTPDLASTPGSRITLEIPLSHTPSGA
jgi:hypothetical protein